MVIFLIVLIFFTIELWIGVLNIPGPLYDADNMLKCLAWIKEKSNEPECLGIFCAHGC